MSTLFKITATVLAFAFVLVNIADATWGRCRFGHRHRKFCSRSCYAPQDSCTSCTLPPAQCTCTRVRPVVETHYTRQQCVTYRNVAETHVRQENCVRKVPVTTFREITVDQGHYKTVWVPNPVTRRVPQTVMTDQVYQRNIPYQVHKKVPVITERTVPVQTVRYITEQYQAQVPSPPVSCAVPGGCAAPHQSWSTPYSPVPGTVHPPVAPAVPQYQMTPTPDEPPTSGPASGAQVYEEWSTIPRRTAANPNGINRTAYFNSAQPRRFVPAPSAAAVWHAQQGRY